jgi:NADH-quinone oxidoreductase subunit M
MNMILVWIILLPLLGGIAAAYFGRRNAKAARWISVITLILELDLLLIIGIWHLDSGWTGTRAGSSWILEYYHNWIPQLGIGIHLAMDGLSLLMLLLTLFLGLISIVSSWKEIRDGVGTFHMNLLLTLAGVIGVFLALDLFLFYFFWELMLVPMYFLIALWGHENRRYASVKFFLFTQLSGLLMFIAILGLYFIHGNTTGTYTFDYVQLLGTRIDPSVAIWLMLGFFIAFAVKLPVLPFHTWLPDAHTEAPTAGSIILAGLMLKTGAYGMLRFMVPFFPEAVADFAPIGMVLAVAGILYGAFLSFAQNDLKRLVAYTSISHMGFVLLGIFTWNELALQGTVMQMICHGVGTGGLFIMAGALQERLHTRDMADMGGLWSSLPRMGGAAMVLAMASLGLPGLGNFIGEFLVLLGTYQKNVVAAAFAATGLIAATAYALRMMQKVFYGAEQGAKQGAALTQRPLEDATIREMSVLVIMIVVLVGLGLYPQPVLNTAGPAIKSIMTSNAMKNPAVSHISSEGASEGSSEGPQEHEVRK